MLTGLKFHYHNLPGVTVDVGVTIEPLEEDGICVLPVKVYRVLDTVSI